MSAEIGKQILDAVKAYVTAQVQPLRESLAQAQAQLMSIQPAVKGDAGERGEKGDTGPAPTDEELIALITPLIPAPVKGDTGERGERGEKGDAGERGTDAVPPTQDELRAIIAPLIPAPLKGERGERGERGEKGDEGQRGPDPTEEQLRALITPLIPAPVQGETGPRGERGEQGATPTADELRALIVPLIPAPVCGEKGTDGKDGKDGEDGEPGRDALALEILAEIDPKREYPRGTYARHAGGLYRSFETTRGARGWECIVEGIAHETETLAEDGRTLVRTTTYSSGREFTREFRFSTVLDRGVYKAEHAYAPGDAVTWAGSVWIAQKLEGNGTTAPTYGKPGTAGSGWRLAVKAGRDART